MISSAKIENSKVLILDDQETSRSILGKVIMGISPNIQLHEEIAPISALNWAIKNAVDLVMVDFLMPGMNGIEFVERLRKYPSYKYVPIIMVTVKPELETKYAALEAGVTDFLIKPVDTQECLARSMNLLTMRHQHLALENKSKHLEKLVAKATEDLQHREKDTLMRLARAGEYRDGDTARHLARISQYCKMLAEALGLEPDMVDLIEYASPLHDIGKIGIPDYILKKKEGLTESEMSLMQSHPQIGHDILQGSPSKYLQLGSEIALAHHEKYDGTGYPFGLSGEKIPLAARIVAVADVFDALTNDRTYKKAWTIEEAYTYMISESGTRFDPYIVQKLIALRPKIEQIIAQKKQLESVV